MSEHSVKRMIGHTGAGLAGYAAGLFLVALPFLYMLPHANACYSYDSRRYDQDSAISCDLFLNTIPLGLAAIFAGSQLLFWLIGVFKPARKYQLTVIPAILFVLIGWIYGVALIALPNLWGFLVGLPMLEAFENTSIWNR